MLIRRLRANLPLTVLGACFLALAFATQCTQDAEAPSTSDPPSLPCSPASVIDDCRPLPRSACLDINQGNGITYYTDPQCLEGRCTWTPKVTYCAGGYCQNGACLSTTTASASFGGWGGGAGAPIVEEDASEAGEDVATDTKGDASDAQADATSDRSATTPLDGGQCADAHSDVCSP